MAGQDNQNNILQPYDPLEGRVTRKYIPESSKQVYNDLFFGNEPGKSFKSKTVVLFFH